MQPNSQTFDIKVVDIDVGGDFHRVILSGISVPPGKSAFDIRDLFKSEYDELRQIMLSHPYGNEDMCANLVFESSNENAPYAHIIMECMGYPYFSGSNTSATIAALLVCGLVPMKNTTDTLYHEAPSGLIEATYRTKDDTIQEIIVAGDDAYVIEDTKQIEIPGYGTVDYALVWSGVVFIMVDAEIFDIKIDEDHIERMKEVGLQFTKAVEETFRHDHPVLGPIEATKFVNFLGPCRKTGEQQHEGLGAVYGYPATVFRCPTGTGTAARMALTVSRNDMEPGAVFQNTSPIGSRFTGRSLGWRNKAGKKMLGVEISSTPYVLSTTTLHVDFDNPSLKPFAKLRDLLEV